MVKAEVKMFKQIIKVILGKIYLQVKTFFKKLLNEGAKIFTRST